MYALGNQLSRLWIASQQVKPVNFIIHCVFYLKIYSITHNVWLKQDITLSFKS